MKPKITVLTTVYNGSLYLEQAIESVLNQTFSDFDFLIIDDASTDNSVEIIKSYNDDRIIFIQNSKNIGQVASLNKGLKIAKGKYIARFDQDDVCLPKRLEEQCDFLASHRRISIISSWEYVIDSDGNKLREAKRCLDNYGAYLGYILLGLCPVWHPSVMFVKDDILKLNGFDASYGPSEDYELWSRIALNRLEGSVVDKFHLLQREHNQRQSILKNDEQALSSLRAHKNVIKYFMGDQKIDDILTVLTLKSGAIDFSKLNIMDMSISLNNLLDKVNSMQKLTNSEFATMRKTINHRIGYGFMLAPSIILLPNTLFKVIFYFASPMYISTLKKVFISIRLLIGKL
jgi:glycosyltransferase involved in cell wall biosynthesis